MRYRKDARKGIDDLAQDYGATKLKNKEKSTSSQKQLVMV